MIQYKIFKFSAILLCLTLILVVPSFAEDWVIKGGDDGVVRIDNENVYTVIFKQNGQDYAKVSFVENHPTIGETLVIDLILENTQILIPFHYKEDAPFLYTLIEGALVQGSLKLPFGNRHAISSNIQVTEIGVVVLNGHFIYPSGIIVVTDSNPTLTYIFPGAKNGMLTREETWKEEIKLIDANIESLKILRLVEQNNYEVFSNFHICLQYPCKPGEYFVGDPGSAMAPHVVDCKPVPDCCCDGKPEARNKKGECINSKIFIAGAGGSVGDLTGAAGKAYQASKNTPCGKNSFAHNYDPNKHEKKENAPGLVSFAKLVSTSCDSKVEIHALCSGGRLLGHSVCGLNNLKGKFDLNFYSTPFKGSKSGWTWLGNSIGFGIPNLFFNDAQRAIVYGADVDACPLGDNLSGTAYVGGNDGYVSVDSQSAAPEGTEIIHDKEGDHGDTMTRNYTPETCCGDGEVQHQKEECDAGPPDGSGPINTGPYGGGICDQCVLGGWSGSGGAQPSPTSGGPVPPPCNKETDTDLCPTRGCPDPDEKCVADWGFGSGCVCKKTTPAGSEPIDNY